MYNNPVWSSPTFRGQSDACMDTKRESFFSHFGFCIPEEKAYHVYLLGKNLSKKRHIMFTSGENISARFIKIRENTLTCLLIIKHWAFKKGYDKMHHGSCIKSLCFCLQKDWYLFLRLFTFNSNHPGNLKQLKPMKKIIFRYTSKAQLRYMHAQMIGIKYKESA